MESSPGNVEPFEPIEKKLIIGVEDGHMRSLPRTFWDEVCVLANCTIVQHTSETDVDTYVLSESSLFVTDTVVMLKTCGTTQPLSALQLLLDAVGTDHVSFVWYNRMSYLGSVSAQPHQHQTFAREIKVLHKFFPNGEHRTLPVHVCPSARTAALMLKTNLFNAFFYAKPRAVLPELSFEEWIFYRIGHDAQDAFVDQVLTPLKGAVVDKEYFEPCGFSCNAIMPNETLNVHISPEDEVAYASVELTRVKDSTTCPGWAFLLFSTFQPVVGVQVRVDIRKLSDLLLNGLSVTCYWNQDLPLPTVAYESDKELDMRTSMCAGGIT
ncbi:MAG: uncharacterized protein KVP18_002000 [Porospora cf. gigantea A]|uniref:uncharacterized protein n=1 Tax=Porospora cf. gigantea A TaxID=2853593 RepID=UPI0035595B2B|nr:MAG: hypothetical protein KVP18_002000 [Porospora cf. gigantea A]